LDTSDQQYTISSRFGDVVLLARDDYENLIETLELLSQDGLLQGVKEAKRDIAKKRVYSIHEVFEHDE